MLKTYALFDFDGTLIRGDSILLLFLYARRKGFVRLRGSLATAGAAIGYGLGWLRPERAKETALRFLAGMEPAALASVVDDFYRTVLKPRLRPEGVQAIRRHREAGHTVLLISASSTFYLQPLQAELGLDGIIGTRFAVEADGRFTGRVCGDNCRGVQKALRLAEYLAAAGDRLDYGTSTAYGDTLGDLPMLRLCAYKVAVNPRKRLWRALRTLEGATRVTWREPA